MTSDRSRRVGRCYRWGFGAVLAGVAGAAYAQQSNTNSQTYQPDQSGQSGTQQGWRQANFIQQLANVNGVVVLSKEENNKTTQVTIQDGRVVAAEVDGQFTSPEKVQVQGSKLRVLDDNNQVVSTFKIPHVSGTAMRDNSDRRYGMNDQSRSWQDQSYQDRSYQDRSQDGWRYRDQTRGEYDRDSYRPDNSRDSWRQDYSNRPDSYRQDYYRQDNYTNRPDPSRDTYNRDYNSRDPYRDYNQNPPSRDYYSRDSYNQNQPNHNRDSYRDTYRQDQYNTRRGRIYGSNYARTPLALGIMTTDATQADLASSSAGTQYTQGVKVERVHEDFPGATAGLQKGDIIVAIDGQTPATTTLLRQRLAEKDPGDTLRLTVLRSGAARDINVQLSQVDTTKYNWDFMGGSTADSKPDEVDPQMLQPNNRREIYRPSEDATGNNGRPAWDRMRDTMNPR